MFNYYFAFSDFFRSVLLEKKLEKFVNIYSHKPKIPPFPEYLVGRGLRIIHTFLAVDSTDITALVSEVWLTFIAYCIEITFVNLI